MYFDSINIMLIEKLPLPFFLHIISLSNSWYIGHALIEVILIFISRNSQITERFLYLKLLMVFSLHIETTQFIGRNRQIIENLLSLIRYLFTFFCVFSKFLLIHVHVVFYRIYHFKFIHIFLYFSIFFLIFYYLFLSLFLLPTFYFF